MSESVNEKQPNVLIFDGDCGFCTTSANWIVAHSKTAISALPFQWTDLESYGLTTKLASDKVWIVVDGERFGGHECIAKIALLQPNLLVRAIVRLMLTRPFSFVAAFVYRQVAKNRHRLPGGTPACKLPQK
jgi:predicted DCC family thiol-disulfide oxidoreductase YuxK